MKHAALFFCIIIFLLISCKESKTVYSPNDTSETWELVTMQSGSFAGANAQPLPYQEKYIFFEDLSFTKSRTEDNQSLEGSGSYKKTSSDEGIYYSLTYDISPPNLLGTCTGTANENLLLRPDGKLQNSWAMCDGPFKVYLKK